jgi:uncharacterized protein YjaZ
MAEKRPDIHLHQVQNMQEEYKKLFLSNEVSINMDAKSLVMDFKSRVPVGNKVFVEHTPIYLDIFQAKTLSSLLSQSIEKFEEKFGKIEEPEFVKNFSKETSKAKDKLKETISENQPKYSYMG